MTDYFADLHVDARELTPAIRGQIGRVLAADMARAIRAAGADPDDDGAVDAALAAAGYYRRTIRPLRQLAALWALTGGDKSDMYSLGAEQ